MKLMEEKVLDTIRAYGLMKNGDNVIAALSGGADSVALFHFLLHHAQALGIRLAAAHFEHGLRGEESLKDAEFVAKLCDSNGIQLYTKFGRMNEQQAPPHTSTEAWARQLRYTFFLRLASEQDALVATAHTQTDQAETVLFNLIRGAGPKGLAGIPEKRGPFIRPLLTVSREEVEGYCRRHDLDFVTDATNAELIFSRNRIRNEVMPQLELAHPGAAAVVARSAADMRALDNWLEEQAGARIREAQLPGGGNPWAGNAGGAQAAGYRAEVLLKAAPPLRLKALAMLAGPVADRACLGRLEQVLRGELGATQLPGGLRAQLRAGALVFEPLPMVTEQLPCEFPVENGEMAFPGGYRLRVKIVKMSANYELSENTGEKGLTFMADYDKISQYGIFRTRRPQDRYAPKGRGHTKALRKWMNEEKIDRNMRDALPLLAHKNEVLWLWHAGFAEGLQLDENTTTLLIIETSTAPRA